MNVVRASLSEVAQASITSPILSPSPSVQSRKPHTASQLTTSARAKPQIACPMPLKVPYATSTKAAASSSQPPKQDSLNDFLDSRDEWDEKNVLFDDSIGYAGNLSSSTDDGESLINLIEAEWELEQIFRTAPTAATNPHKRRFAWTLNEEDPLDSEHESSSWMLVEDDDLPRLGFSPQSRMEEAISAPSSLLPSPLCVVPPSRARNPVPLNTPFQASPSSSSSFLVDRAYQQQQQPARRDLYTSSPFFGADPNSHSDYALTEDYGLRVIEQRLEDCTLLSPSSSSSLAVPPSSPSSAVLGGHTRKRNRSYSDSMLKRDGVSDVANNLVVVS